MNPRRARVIPAAVMLAVTLGGCGGADATDSSAARTSPSTTEYAVAEAKDVTLADGWVAAPAGDAAMTAAYATLTTGGTKDALVAVETPVGEATVHETVTSADGSSARMRPAPRVEIPVGESVTLEPGGYHVMVMNLDRDLEPGTSIPMTWTFRSGAEVTTRFPVIDVAERPAAGHHPS